jgi:hypothetical protein
MRRQQLLQSIATTIFDYRRGEIPTPNAEHVDRWVQQFNPPVQEALLAELDYVLKRTYLSHRYFVDFFEGMAKLKRAPWPLGLWQHLRAALTRLLSLAKPARTPAPPTFWQGVNFLDIQKHGGQHEMLDLFEETLKERYGLSLAHCGSPVGPYVYLDDMLFTGNRIILDLVQWIRQEAPARAQVVVMVMVCYRRGLWYTHRMIRQAAAKARKEISLSWLRSIEFEDRRWPSGAVDGFHPTRIPDDPLARAYAEMLANAGYPPHLRLPDPHGASRIFSSEGGRQLLEEQLLLAGVKIRSFCRNPKDIMRPLGYHNLKTLGFGAPMVTYRNCPNNCPLALWWGDPGAARSHPLGRWYPLFPRKT